MLGLLKSRLYVKLQVVKSDGTNLGPNEKVGIVSLPFQTMFSQVDVYMKNTLVSVNANTFP